MAARKLKGWAAALVVVFAAALTLLVATEILLPSRAEEKLQQALQLPQNASVEVAARPALKLCAGDFDKVSVSYVQDAVNVSIICFDDSFDGDFLSRADEYILQADISAFRFAEPFHNIGIDVDKNGNVTLDGPFEMWGAEQHLKADGKFIVSADGILFDAENIDITGVSLEDGQQLEKVFSIPLIVEIPLENAELSWEEDTLQIRSVVDGRN